VRLVSTPYRWLWRTWRTNLVHWFWDVRNGVNNLFIFFEAVWWFRSWDWSGLAELIEVAAKQMRRAQENGCHTGSERYAKQLLVVQNLCRRLREDNYFENAGYNDKTWKQMPEFRTRQIARHSTYMSQQDALYLGKMFKFLQCWWE